MRTHIQQYNLDLFSRYWSSNTAKQYSLLEEHKKQGLWSAYERIKYPEHYYKMALCIGNLKAKVIYICVCKKHIYQFK